MKVPAKADTHVGVTSRRRYGELGDNDTLARRTNHRPRTPGRSLTLTRRMHEPPVFSTHDMSCRTAEKGGERRPR